MARVNLKAIAQAAGVSISTASRVLSGSSYPVNDELRERVETASRQLDYVPNAQAQGLLHGNPRAVGVLAGDLADPYVADIVTGIHRSARELGCSVTTVTADAGAGAEIAALSLLQSQHVGTVVIMNLGASDTDHAQQLDAKIASLLADDQQVVLLGRLSTAIDVPVVQVNDVLAGRLLGDHLRTLGHLRVAVLTDRRRTAEHADRVRGLTQIHGDHVRVIETGGTRADAESAVADLVTEGSEVTAVVGLSDELAIGALAALQERDIAVPQEMSVAGCHDLWFARDIAPSLTTVHLPVVEMGALSLHLGLAAREGRIERRILPVHLEPRGSTGPAPSDP